MKTVIIRKLCDFIVNRTIQLPESEYVRLESLFKWIPPRHCLLMSVNSGDNEKMELKEFFGIKDGISN